MLLWSLVDRRWMRAAGFALTVMVGLAGTGPAGLAAVSTAKASASAEAAAPAKTTSPPTAQSSETHVVKPGDTLYGLAKAHHTDVDTLKKMNDLTGNIIYVGQSLAVPAAAPRLYRVKSGDTLWSISREFGTSVSELAKANGLSNPNRLSVGAVLTVPAGTGAATETKTASAALPSGLSFIWPLLGAITSNYGLRDGEMHEGIDIAASYGTSIKAAADGVVQSVGWIAGYGLAVIIQHPGGYRTLYAHTQKTLVKRGAVVKQGQVIAKVGSTGHSTGPHLHFEISKDSRTMDPLKLLSH